MTVPLNMTKIRCLEEERDILSYEIISILLFLLMQYFISYHLSTECSQLPSSFKVETGKMLNPDWFILFVTIAACSPYIVITQSKGFVHLTFKVVKYEIINMGQLSDTYVSSVQYMRYVSRQWISILNV